MGNMINTNDSNEKPIQIKPLLNIQVDVKKKKNDLSIKGKSIIKYLSELSIYITDKGKVEKKFSPQFSNYFYRQFIFPKYSDYKHSSISEIPIDRIKSIFSDLNENPLDNINVTGGNVFEYSHFNELIDLLKNSALNKIFHITYLDFDANQKSLKQIENNNFIKNILINLPIEDAHFAKAVAPDFDTILSKKYLYRCFSFFSRHYIYLIK